MLSTMIKQLIPRKIYYLLNSGKNSKATYYINSYIAINLPQRYLAWKMKRLLKSLDKRKDKAYIQERVDYYNQLSDNTPFHPSLFQQEATTLAAQTITGQKVYYLDSYRYARAFPPFCKWVLLPGDITHIPAVPSITKSRPLAQGNDNSVLMKLDKVRHFLFVKDKLPFRQKQDKVIFRGLIGQDGGTDLKQNRYDFVKMFFQHPLCDIGVLDKQYPQWYTEKITLKEHLNYKFIMALEGNDVASNLKWVMSSNAVAVMPRPTCETWFMEGKLIPDYHYIEIKPDYSDLEEKINYYIAHPEKAEAIVANAHAYIEQFKDKKRESLISFLVLKKYFDFIQTKGIS